MRIAFSGTHCVGKTSLIDAVAAALPGYVTLDEPYHLLEEEGYEHSDPPSLEDFQAQLERSIQTLEESEDNVLFDRCPADVLAYLLTHDDIDEYEPDESLDRTRESMQQLDLVVFVPIEQPDRIALPAHEDPRYRMRVHKQLEHLLLDDAYDFGTEVLVVEGNLQTRCARVLARIKAGR
jgi:predicted ATPase